MYKLFDQHGIGTGKIVHQQALTSFQEDREKENI